MKPDATIVIEKNYKSILLPWITLFLFNVIIISIVLFFIPHQDTIEAHTLRIINNIYFLMFILAILTIYFIKKNKLRTDILNQFVESESVKIALPDKWLQPLEGEKEILNGLPFYLRFHFLTFYLVLAVLSILNMAYFMITMDRRGFYMFFIVTLFSLFIHYPRKHIWNKMQEVMEETEEDYDPF